MQENNNNPYVSGPVKKWKMTPEELASICRKTSDHLPRGIKAVCQRNDAVAVVKRKKHRSRGPDALIELVLLS
ncbi:hypothetical protein KQR56_15765 [Bacillus velezensis]|nr:hypothetical protein [Bacillus velezensis]